MSRLKGFNRVLVVCTLLFLLTSTVAGTDDQLKGEIDWENGQIVVMGFGAPPEGVNRIQGKLMAQRAAKADAYRNALEMIEGIRVSSETVVKDYVTTNDEIFTQVQGFIQGGIFTDIQYDLEDVCQVTLVLPLGGKRSLASMMEEVVIEDIPQTVIIEPVKPENQTQPIKPIPEYPGLQNYTGIIFDARGLNVKPAIYPQIFDSKGYLLYGPTTVNVDQAGFTTMVAYSRSLEKAITMERVGANPLLVSATSTVKSRKGTATDIVVDTKTAEILRRLMEQGDFISRGAVVFVID